MQEPRLTTFQQPLTSSIILKGIPQIKLRTPIALKSTLEDLKTPGIYWGNLRSLYTEDRQDTIETFYLELREGSTRSNFEVIDDVVTTLGLPKLDPTNKDDVEFAEIEAKGVIRTRPLYHSWDWVFQDRVKELEDLAQKIIETQGVIAYQLTKQTLFRLERPVRRK